MKREKSLIKRLIPLLIILIVFAAALAVTPTLARYIRGSADVKNDGTSAGSVNSKVVTGELKDGTLKDVSFEVGKTGYPVFVRVEIVVTWKAEDGSKLYLQPQPSKEGKKGDYEITFNSKWEKLGDYWYYTEGVKSKGKTPVLVTSFTQLTKEAPFDKDLYVMNVEFIVQTVQAVGHTDEGGIPAWRDAWELDLNKGSGSNQGGSGTGTDSGDSGEGNGSTQEP